MSTPACDDEERYVAEPTVVVDAGLLLDTLVRTHAAKIDEALAWDAGVLPMSCVCHHGCPMATNSECGSARVDTWS